MKKAVCGLILVLLSSAALAELYPGYDALPAGDKAIVDKYLTTTTQGQQARRLDDTVRAQSDALQARNAKLAGLNAQMAAKNAELAKERDPAKIRDLTRQLAGMTTQRDKETKSLQADEGQLQQLSATRDAAFQVMVAFIKKMLSATVAPMH